MRTHWKKWSNNKYMGSWDFEPGEEKVLVIDRVEWEEVTSPDGSIEKRRVVYFEGEQKPFILNNINSETISEVLGSPYMEEWHGKGIILTVQKVQAFGKLTDAIRVRPVKPYECEECGEPIMGNSEETPLEVKNRIKKKFGRVLCTECARMQEQQDDQKQE